MKTRHGMIFLLLASALAAADQAAVPPLPGEAAPAVATPAAPTPTATVSLPSVTPAAGGTSVLSKFRLPPAAQKTKDSIKPPPISPRFLQVREHMADLFQGRTDTPPVVDPAKNPFRPAGAAPAPVAAVTSSDGVTMVQAQAPTASDVELLKQVAAIVKVSGWAERDGRTLLTINNTLYRDGDVMKLNIKGQTLYLRLSKFSRSSLTLTLNEAETIVRF